MTDSPSRKKKLRGGKIDIHAYVEPNLFDRLECFRDPDDGDRWESALLRKVIREWLEMREEKKITEHQPARQPDRQTMGRGDL